MRCTALLAVLTFVSYEATSRAAAPQLDVHSQEVLSIPPLSDGVPAPGKRVIVISPEYQGTDVFHTVYLPNEWQRSGTPIPIVFEYTGNRFPRSGSTGEPEDAGLGFGLTGGKYIWVSLPYVSQDGRNNAVTWWGDEAATIAYAKRNVPRIIEKFNANSEHVLLCGFSRGAIGVTYLGLHDDEISRFWTAFITHDHFDGVREWRNTEWGTPLEKYRAEARLRLKRVGKRPFLVCQNGGEYGTEDFVKSVFLKANNFTFHITNTAEIFGHFPNRFAKSAHTDRWLLKPSRHRTAVWTWMNDVSGH